MATKKKWIQSAISSPGSLRRTAKAAGAVNKKGTIDVEWLKKKAKEKTLTGKRARLALTLRKLK